jgi:hypothetical protein
MEIGTYLVETITTRPSVAVPKGAIHREERSGEVGWESGGSCEDVVVVEVAGRNAVDDNNA